MGALFIMRKRIKLPAVFLSLSSHSIFCFYTILNFPKSLPHHITNFCQQKEKRFNFRLQLALLLITMVGLRAFKFTRAARKISFPCGCGGSGGGPVSPTQANDNISRSPVTPANSKNVSSVYTEELDPATTLTKTSCPICLEPLSYSSNRKSKCAIFTAQCSHAFHFTCISSNVRHGNVTCPICRAYWTQLPRDLNLPPMLTPTTTTDPILRILDDSIATMRVHRRSSLHTARYNDDDPIIEPQHPTTPNHQNRRRLHFTFVTPPDEFNCVANHAYLSVKLAQQPATDLVLVASSPNVDEPHQYLKLLKQSMALVVFSLRSIDRLALVVTYSSSATAATRAIPLRRMTCHGKRAALQVIDRLFFYMGDTDAADPPPATVLGLSKAVKILEDRRHQNPHSSILHLSTKRSRCYDEIEIQPPTSFSAATKVHWFQVGFGANEFEEFLARLLGGVIRDTCLRIGEDGEVIHLGELRGGEERKIPMYYSNESESVNVTYSYLEQQEIGDDDYDQNLTTITGEVRVNLADGKSRSDHCRRDMMNLVVGRPSASVDSLEYHDPYMARRWAKHLHGYRL